MTLELSEKDLVILERVKKLLAIANDERGNEHQAAAAAAKAQELLDQYNLDMALVGQTAKGSQRSDTRLSGGLYKWQRYLWEAVTHLNFCMYWSIKGNRKGATYEHRILGRQHNVVGARVLADYLQQTIERLAQETARERGVNVFCKPMIAFREGMAERLCERLYQLRRERVAEEERKKREAEERAKANGQSTGTSLVTLNTVMQDENDLNIDHLYGLEPGTTARQRQEAIVRHRKREEELERWKQENPEEWKRIQEQRKKESDEFWKREERNARRRKGRSRRMTPEEERRMLAEFGEGYERGDEVSLHQQVKEAKSDIKKLN